MGLFSRKKKPEPEVLFDAQKEYPVIRCSICNGEQVAGFKDKATGHFREYALIRNGADLEAFKARCGIEDIAKEY
ncbi:MAG: aspartate dehydrogenase [Lachnospiraceae bacterium]|nr:aspartate dehydrogenase [Lachnospiraceae bacterium]